MTTGQRISKKRQELGISLRALGRLISAAPATVSLWEHDTNQPNSENLLKLAKALNTTPEWLRHGHGVKESKNIYNIEPASKQPATRKLPVISHVHAGNWAEAIDYYAAGDDVEWEDAPYSTSTNAFWLRVVGDSMTSPVGLSITEGMLILVDPDIAPENGKLVVAKLDGTDEVTFKKLVIDAGQKYLKPLNQSYRPIDINGNCQIVGVVTELKLKL
jgi:SOS-response transcriptional repressor LexA